MIEPLATVSPANRDSKDGKVRAAFNQGKQARRWMADRPATDRELEPLECMEAVQMDRERRALTEVSIRADTILRMAPSGSLFQ